ncbi:hypothetical protein [Paractinoplanes rishiriensis]|nr:hypothetical protein [Actinoplanes rishiriensis]
MTDRLEDNNADGRWTIWSTGNGRGGWQAGVGFVFHNQETGWTEIGRDVTITPLDGSHTCRAYIDLFGLGNGRQVIARVEVIDPTTWQYLAQDGGGVATVPIQHFTPEWSNGPRTVRFRVSLYGNGDQTLWIDNMFISCEY